MAPEAQAKEQVEEVANNFTSMTFRSKRDGGPDNELISLGQRFVEQETRVFGDKALPTFKMRTCIERMLRLLTGTPTDIDIDFFQRRIKPEYIERLHGQIAGEQG